jgi:uncharacterized Zn-finger protein
MAWSAHEKETTQKLLREFVLQLCRLNVGNSGCYEVDGIICITRGGSDSGASEEQIVVKVHEQVNLDLPCGSLLSQSASPSVLKEYLSSHPIQPLKAVDRCDTISRSGPIQNLKRKANDENDNAIIDVGRTVHSRNSGGWSHLKMHRRSDVLEEFASFDKEGTLDNSQDGVPQDLTKSSCENFYGEDSENNGPDVHCCGSCLLDFDSLDALQQHFTKVHSISLEHFCPLCAVGFVVASDLIRHNTAAHTQQSSVAVRRRKQSKPRRGMISDIVANESMEEDGDLLEPKMSESPPSDCEVKSESTSSIRLLLQKRPLMKTDEDNQSVESGRMTLDVGAERICRHCSTVFPDFPSFSVHCRSVHRRFPCPYCLQTFTQRVNRDRHLYNHTGEKPFVCRICGSAFTRKDALKKHQLKANHQVTEGESITDEQVGVLLPGTDQSEDSSEEGDASQSDECGLDLSTGVNSVKATKEKAKDGRVSCIKSAEDDDSIQSDGRQSYANNFNLAGMKTSPVYPSSNEIPESEVLPALTKTNAALAPSLTSAKSSASARIRLLYSDQNRTYSCDICRESVTGATAFEMHCRTLHRRTPCVYCGKTFSQKGNMERHQRQHTGERPFACPFCTCSYTRKETLKVHINQAHPTSGLSLDAANSRNSL